MAGDCLNLDIKISFFLIKILLANKEYDILN